MLAIGFMLYEIGEKEKEILKAGGRLPKEFFYTKKPSNKVVFSNPRQKPVLAG